MGRMSVWSYLLAALPNAGLQRFVAKGEFICKAAKGGDENKSPIHLPEDKRPRVFVG